jgi:hypothetical protein
MGDQKQKSVLAQRCQVTRSFKAPFARASREDDYRVAWAFFASESQNEAIQ